MFQDFQDQNEYVLTSDSIRRKIREPTKNHSENNTWDHRVR